jgi:hypothetical protein
MFHDIFIILANVVNDLQFGILIISKDVISSLLCMETPEGTSTLGFLI